MVCIAAAAELSSLADLQQATLFRGVKMEKTLMSWRQHVQIGIPKSFTVFMGLFRWVNETWPCNGVYSIHELLNNYRSLGGFRNTNFMLNSEPLRLFCYPFKSAHGDCPILDTGELRLAMRTADPCPAPAGTFCSRFMSWVCFFLQQISLNKYKRCNKSAFETTNPLCNMLEVDQFDDIL
jgi:hypothetical protein